MGTILVSRDAASLSASAALLNDAFLVMILCALGGVLIGCWLVRYVKTEVIWIRRSVV